MRERIASDSEATPWWQGKGRQERREERVQDAEQVGGADGTEENQTQPFPQGAWSSLERLHAGMSAST